MELSAVLKSGENTTSGMGSSNDRVRRLSSRARLYGRAVCQVLKVRSVRKRPIFISHLITTRCMAKCPTCLWRGESPEVTDTQRILDFYRRVREAGFVSTNLWGGEPLLRDDIGAIVQTCWRLGLVTGLVTNGLLLSAKAADVAPYLNYLMVSIDVPSSDHDGLRGVPGLFDRALHGIRTAQMENPRLKVLLNAVVSRHSYPEVLGVARLAREIGVTATFEVPEEGMPLFRKADAELRCRLAPSKEQEAFSQLGALKASGEPVNNSHTYLRMFADRRQIYRCRLPKMCLRVAPDGTGMNCLHPDRPLGNVYEDKLDKILDGPANRQLRTECSSCHRCKNTGTIETSLFWSFRPEILLNTFKLFLTP